MSKTKLSAAESHELACRVSALGAKQVLALLRSLQNQVVDQNRTIPSSKRTPPPGSQSL